MDDAALEPKSHRAGRRGYTMHGDSHRQRLVRERGVSAIDARRIPGRDAKKWRRYALSKKGGKSCAPDIRQKIDAGTFYLWRALELRSFIVSDARTRGTPVNRRSRKLLGVNAEYDTAMGQWERINDDLQLDKTGVDLATRLAQARSATRMKELLDESQGR